MGKRGPHIHCERDNLTLSEEGATRQQTQTNTHTHARTHTLTQQTHTQRERERERERERVRHTERHAHAHARARTHTHKHRSRHNPLEQHPSTTRHRCRLARNNFNCRAHIAPSAEAQVADTSLGRAPPVSSAAAGAWAKMTPISLPLIGTYARAVYTRPAPRAVVSAT